MFSTVQDSAIVGITANAGIGRHDAVPNVVSIFGKTGARRDVIGGRIAASTAANCEGTTPMPRAGNGVGHAMKPGVSRCASPVAKPAGNGVVKIAAIFADRMSAIAATGHGSINAWSAAPTVFAAEDAIAIELGGFPPIHSLPLA